MPAATQDAAAIVKRLLASAETREEAVVLLMRKAEQDSELREALITRYRPQLLREVCLDAVRSESREVRQRARTLVRSDNDFGILGSRIEAAKRELDLWTLPDGGAKLLYSSREDLLAAVEWHKAQMTAHRTAMAFYLKIIQRLAPNQVVSEALTREEIRDMLAEVEGAR